MGHGCTHPKGGGGCWVIGFIEVLWKAIEIIIDRLLTMAIEFNYVLYGLW